MKRIACVMLGFVCAFSNLHAKDNSPLNTPSAYIVPIDGEGTWLDYAADAFAGGNGTAESPYIIETPEQLAKIAKDVSESQSDYTDVWFSLANDLDLGDHEWFPIGFKADGSGTFSFGGKFNGNGHSIHNLKMTLADAFTNGGLFGQTTATFELRNLTIESGEIIGATVVGSLVGRNLGIIENCVNKANVSCSIYYVGGIAGSNSGSASTIRNCQNFGAVSGGYGGANGMSAGGIVGSSSSVIEKCINYGTVTSLTAGAGGIVAIMEGGSIRHCINRGSLQSLEQVGGIASSVLGRTKDCEIYNCYSACEMAGSGGIGGVIGVAMCPTGSALKAADLYFDLTLYSGPAAGTMSDPMGVFEVENLLGKSTEDMKNAEFVNTLNVESGNDQSIWMQDDLNLNDGYPVLDFMVEAVGIEDVVSENEIGVKVENNHIFLEGVENDVLVDVYSVNGYQVFTGASSALAAKYLEGGFYLVKVGAKAYKVYVNA